MANIAVSDKVHDEVERMAHVQYTTKKDVTEKMVAFVVEREEMFYERMF